MGTKYSSQSSTGYNASPPPDDGTTVAANKITWGSTIKTKIGDPLLNFITAVNSAIVNALNFAFSTTSTAYTTLAADNCTVIEVTGTTTISLGDAATKAAGYLVGVMNKGTAVVTVALITAANTLNGNANGTVKLLPGQCMIFGVNQAANGYDIISDANRAPIILTGAAGTNTITAACDAGITGLSAGQTFVLVPANTITGAATLNITPSGGSALTAKNVFSGGASCTGGELVANAPALLEYDGTQLNIIGTNFSASTFTPGISFGGGTTGITYTTQVGTYTKIGNRVFFNAYVVLSNKGSSTGAALLTGLPFTSNPTTNNNVPCSSYATSLSTITTNDLMFYISPSTTSVHLTYLSAGAASNMDDTIFTNTTAIMIAGHYSV